MRRIKTGNFLLALLTIFLINPFYSYAEQKQKLPRSYGPIYLGMSVEEFKKATGVEVKDIYCATCVEGEIELEFSILEKDVASFEGKPIKFPIGSIAYQSATSMPESIICRFYKGKLYLIFMESIKDIPELLKNRYIKVFGKPISEVDYGTGRSRVSWKDYRTELDVNYSTGERGIDYISIAYTDLKIFKQVPSREMPDE